MAELSTPVAEPSWFCIRTHLKHEHVAAAHLRLIEGIEVFNPQLRLLRSTRRGRVWFIESLFPNYVFASFALEAKLEKVRCTPSVRAVLQFGAKIPTIPNGVIQQLQRDIEEMKSKTLTDMPEEGEEVEVATGAFKGLKGPVVRVLPAKQRVQVLLEVMGRPIPAEVSLGSLLFRRKEAANLVLKQAEMDHRLPKSAAAGRPLVMLPPKSLKASPAAPTLVERPPTPRTCPPALSLI